ncbi:protein spire isoform X2 [Bacillus rossius redtenbacheri]|uniref:protein spire isoform X2 n=1 Tax=Bacillus rossius redtenbacheri TaxID=93214 RepID=UPI002FDDC62D
MAADVKVSRCRLDADGCVCLRDMLLAFNSPITEQHAWALVHGCARCLKAAVESDRRSCLLVKELGHVLIHRDGHVHASTVFGGRHASGSRSPMTSEKELVSHLGYTVFQALDFGFGEEEQRELSPDLSRLIDRMTSADEVREAQHETDDEGIERDSGDSDEESSQYCTLDTVIEHCMNHLAASTPQEADAHYRAVCRALVAEALELSSFLDKVSQGTHELQQQAAAHSKDLDQLKFTDWARLWVQVIRELRHGVNLKKVGLAHGRAPIEYELTPYEILMDDIRSRRYKLNKVMVDGDIPHRVKRDAHAVILEFIRSRPPLRKAADRQLAPARGRPKAPRELLMEAIKQGRRLRPAYSPLKKRVIPVEPVAPPASKDTPKSTRRLIRVDFSRLKLQDEDDDDDEEDLPSPPVRGTQRDSHAGSSTKKASPWRRTGTLTPQEYHSYIDSALASYDLATQCPARRAVVRRHTIVAAAAEAGTQSLPHSRPASRGPALSSASSETDYSNMLGCALPEMSWSRSSLQDELLHSNWQQAMECVSLTLEEIVHIRSVLTKAELEGLPVEGHVKEDVEKRKVCFLCLKTRFGLFGPRGNECKLCKRTICSRCSSKMRIPTEHFSQVPVYALSPGLSSPEEEAKDSFPRSLMSRLMVPQGARNSVGSAPSSPHLTRGESASAPGSGMGSSMADSMEGPMSLPACSPASASGDRRSRLNRSMTMGQPQIKKEKLKGLQMIVCHDCKMMVIQIIKTSRTSRNNAIRNLTLNLSPVY